MDDVVSVIIPVYNVLPYLEKCINSVINQFYKNLEIILVDDGSTDGSGQMCDDFAKLDKRIIVLHQENSGLSEARNNGFSLAKGKFISFVDSDDYIHPKMIQVMMEATKKQNAEIVICNYKEVTVNSIENTQNESLPQEFAETILTLGMIYGDKFDMGKHTLYTVAWGKLYERRIFDGIKYPKGLIHEDEFTTYKVLNNANIIILIDQPLYYYLKREDSIMGRKFELKRLSLLDAFQEQLSFFQNIEDDRRWINSYIGMKSMILRYMKLLEDSPDLDMSPLRKYLYYYKEQYALHCKNLKLNKVEKVKCMLFSYTPFIYYRYFKSQM